jgi:DNA repair exonuclease SbcCD nuclease subunit
MIKILYVGDVHVQVSNLDESERLLHFVNDTALEQKVDRIVILGDLFHTFALLRLEVIDFWKDWLDNLSEICETVVLVGNHDMGNSGNDDHKTNALNVYTLMKKKNLRIVEHPQVHGPFGYISYIHDNEKFIQTANALTDQGAKVIIAHMEADGAQYENGYYSPNGVDLNRLKCDLIISGHIHSRQRFGKLILPGIARWLTTSDANQERGLWLVEHDDKTGAILKEEFIDTSSVCSPIRAITWQEGEEAPKPWGDNDRVALELIGSSEWIIKQKVNLKGKCAFKTKITDTKKTEGRKPGRNLEDFIKNVFTSTNKESLLRCAKELNLV